MIKKGFSYIGIFFLYSLARLPLGILYGLASLIYYLVYHVFRYRRKVVHENLRNSFPDRTEDEILILEKQYFKYLCNLIVEIIKMPLISKNELEKRFVFKNMSLIQGRLKKGESMILCSAHYGNWEWGMLALGLQFSNPKYVIYKPLNNPLFEAWFYKSRARFGNSPIPMKQTLRTVIQSKNHSSVFCFASDQTPVQNPANYWLDFLSQPTVVFSGAEKIAVQTNRPVYYSKVSVIKRGYYEVEFIQICEEPKNEEEHSITHAQFKLLEETILEEPQYWLWSHRRWKHKPATL